MRRPRPFMLVLGGLAVMGVLRTTTAIFFPETDSEPSAFVSSAHASGGTEQPMPVPAAVSAPAPPMLCETPEEMLQAMSEERALLDAQKARLIEQQSEVELAQEKLGIEQKRLADLKTELEGLLATVAKAQTDDLDRLVALYSSMKPKEAAAILDDMDIETSVMVLATMPERDAAPILAALNRVRARAISRIILERSKLPGDQRLQGLKL
ncbi:MotE family protein [Seohaeicola zhoushanensis]|uniref:Magnesium transporter MgtE intracellular domain-containing protein n=1 Tax=Seohaeicola zhoushanensis TaxID=1569283 RepID=A0A8J3GUH6_9RHOB|nr:hypothetical protein [Seohaeicola zhoushanensis]GHF36069.1 hypothetical protein GCM10017056_04790 [Seohaeicola zhoushanensis]